MDNGDQKLKNLGDSSMKPLTKALFILHLLQTWTFANYSEALSEFQLDSPGLYINTQFNITRHLFIIMVFLY